MGNADAMSILALFGHAGAARRCQFTELKRTSQLRAPKSENDPKATSAAPSDNDYPFASLQQTRDSNVHHHSGRHPRDVRLRRFNCRGRSISGHTRPLSNGAEIADMKKPTLRIEEQQPRNIQRADIAPLSGYAIVVDFKDLRRGLPLPTTKKERDVIPASR
jgi:hypothetical protein